MAGVFVMYVLTRRLPHRRAVVVVVTVVIRSAHRT
jgi:hypothetical protein